MSSLSNIYKWASASVALLPGLTVILTDLGTPPSISKVIYGGIIEACGAFTFLLLYLNRKKIAAITDARINRNSIILFVLFLISLLVYVVLFNSQVVYSSKYDTKLFFPFWYKEDLQYMVKQAGSKLNAISSYGPQAVADSIANSQPYLEITSLLFTLLYVSVFEYLVIGFGLPGFKASDAIEPDQAS